MAVRLEPQDEYMHELGPEPNFNESMYFNVFDPTNRVGGFFRLGNRANEGTAEMTCCLYLPDGRVGFMFKRPDIDDNDAFDAAGMRFAVQEPFKALSVDFQIATEWEDDEHYHRRITATLRSKDQQWKVQGRVLSLIPLRNRRPDSERNMLVTRISEGMTEWTLADGRVGYGLSEYLDQIIEGEPVGLA